MADMFKSNGKAVLQYLKDNDGTDVTAETIASALGMQPRSVNGTLTSLQREISGHGQLIERVEVEGFDKKVIRLTDEGRAISVDAQKPEKAAE